MAPRGSGSQPVGRDPTGAPMSNISLRFITVANFRYEVAMDMVLWLGANTPGGRLAALGRLRVTASALYGRHSTRPSTAGTPENTLISPALPHREPIPP